MLFKTASSKKRILIIVLLFTFMTYLFTVFGGSSLFILYELNEPLCWNEVYIGYGAAAFTSVSLTSFLGVYFFSKCLKDIYIVFIGIFSYVGGIIMAAFAKTTLLMFLGEFRIIQSMLKNIKENSTTLSLATVVGKYWIYHLERIIMR